LFEPPPQRVAEKALGLVAHEGEDVCLWVVLPDNAVDGLHERLVEPVLLGAARLGFGLLARRHVESNPDVADDLAALAIDPSSFTVDPAGGAVGPDDPVLYVKVLRRLQA